MCIYCRMFMFTGRRLCGPYLQVASGRCVVDLDIRGVSVRQLEAVSQPRNRHIAGVSQHFTADVGWVALPRVHRYWSQDFRGICDERQSIYKWKTNKPADPLSTNRPSTSAKGEQKLHSHYLWSLNSEDKVVKDQNVLGLNIELKAECLKHSALRCWTHLFVAVHKSQSRFTGFKRPLLQAASLNSMLGADIRHDAPVTQASGPRSLTDCVRITVGPLRCCSHIYQSFRCH